MKMIQRRNNDELSVLYPYTSFIWSRTLGQLHQQTMPGKKALLIISNGKSAIENGYLSRTEAELQKLV